MIYVSGPMTGRPDHNLPAFADATARLRALGYEVCNPGHRGEIPGYRWADYMRDALQMLLDCKAVALLPGWGDSRGAVLEVHVAEQLGLPVDSLTDWILAGERGHRPGGGEPLCLGCTALADRPLTVVECATALNRSGQPR